MGEAGSIFDDIERCCKLIGDKKVKSICLNDSDRSEEEFLKAKERLIGEFERAFPDKSSFEI